MEPDATHIAARVIELLQQERGIGFYAGLAGLFVSVFAYVYTLL